MTQEAIQEIIRKQRNYFYTGATLNIDFRITALKKLQTSIQSHQEQINAALKSDLGKSSFESYMCESGLVRDYLYTEAHPLFFQRKNRAHTTCPVPFQKLQEAVPIRCHPDHEPVELSLPAYL